ncbi:hypothetical protein LZ30DRAFT_812593 [Colletotrichum cereale]|nr:hypothetical protein LZ30DRAFT_812593 [Colletotrichum cereale]
MVTIRSGAGAVPEPLEELICISGLSCPTRALDSRLYLNRHKLIRNSGILTGLAGLAPPLLHDMKAIPSFLLLGVVTVEIGVCPFNTYLTRRSLAVRTPIGDQVYTRSQTLSQPRVAGFYNSAKDSTS